MHIDAWGSYVVLPADTLEGQRLGLGAMTAGCTSAGIFTGRVGADQDAGADLRAPGTGRGPSGGSDELCACMCQISMPNNINMKFNLFFN